MTKTMYCLRVCISFLAVTVFLPVAALSAQKENTAQPNANQGWQALVAGHPTTPPRLVAVDKTRQTLFVFERQSPLRIADQYTCTTGQAEGDKLVRGDLKTPEGIYFVSQKLSSGLDFTKYGNEAYTLNYPNPVDRLRKKTGYGIWIHGRGTPIIPKETQGCVALNNGDIAMLGRTLPPGTPVALAASVNFTPAAPAQDKTILSTLEKRTHAWAKAWGSRSKTLFDYYDPDAYSVAQGESFAAFRAQKERLFKQLPWIDTKIHGVQALQGPGYWVTWFEQDYRAPNLSTKGVRRLYWQRDTKGELRIVGMEWAPHLSGTLTASLGAEAANPPVESNPRSEEDTSPRVEPAQKPLAAPAATPPVSAAPATPPATATPIAVATATPPAATVPAAPAPAKPEKPAAPAKPDPAADLEKAAADGAAFVEAWRKAWENADRAKYVACYDKGAVQGERKGVAAIDSHKRAVWAKTPPKRVKLTNLRITVASNGIVADMQQEYSDKGGFADKGIKTLHLKKVNNSWRITQEDWSPLTP